MFEVRIAARQMAAQDIVAVELVPVDGTPLPGFAAGAHIDVQVAPGLIRQYSLHNDPRETHRYCIGVLKDPASRGGSQAVHRGFQVGDIVSISAPRNLFPVDDAAAESVLLAGGIGITPILCMAEHLAAQGRPFSLHYCARSRERAAFVERLQQPHLAAAAALHFDAEGERFSLAGALEGKVRTAHLYICGPGGFINAMKEAALALGMGPAQIHIEHFGAEVALDGGAFTVVAQRSGLEFQVAETETIAQALAARGVCVALSCEQGVCGTCLTRVVEGIPDHRDLFQSDEEKEANDMITICCSRAKSGRLVLDL